MPRLRALLLLAAAGMALTVAGASPAPGGDAQANLRLLRDLRESDPEQYARLVRNFERFRALPPDQQDRLRRLDQQLNEESPESRDRLLHVLSEYASWLTRLPEADRQRVLAAASADDRLKVVRAIRERQWLESLPPARLAEWNKAAESERKRLVERWKQEERARHEEWVEARRWEAVAPERSAGPASQDELRERLTSFIEKKLVPMLSPEERLGLRPPGGSRLNPGAWLANVVRLSDRHPVLALEPRYLYRKDLPDDYRAALDNPPAGKSGAARLVEGKWPDYPVAVSHLLRDWKVPVKQQLGPATAREVSPDVERFVATRLTDDDRKRLKAEEGKWPEYVLALHKIARERKLSLPDLGLPGDPQMWERMRSRGAGNLPEPPEWMLRRFALELSRKNPEAPKLSLNTPAEREILKEKFYEQHPELKRRPPAPERPKKKP